MSCPHPQTAQHVDRSRGTVTCTICGEVVNDQQLELDPLFSRGERPTTQNRGLRSLGQPRPMRSTTHVTPISQRPSVELARRHIFNIARQLEINGDVAEMATGIYKLAVSNNAVSGARMSVLCACLYAVCRKEGTNHVIYDFADATKESPYEILQYMRYICEATHTSVPPLDASLIVYRFAEQLHLGAKTRPVAVCALKIIRTMRDDWIEYGRRPLGVVAAALVAACHALGTPRSPEELCGMVRLAAGTIHRRLIEFMATPTAALSSIDEYKANAQTAPPAYHVGSALSAGTSTEDQLREVAALYYELVAEAKRCAPPTPERCERWRRFITQHCALNGIDVEQDNCDLNNFSFKQQLVVLGLPHAVPVNPDGTVADDSVKEEPLTLPAEAAPLSFHEQLNMFEELVKSSKDIQDLNQTDFATVGVSASKEATSSEAVDVGTVDAWDTIRIPPMSHDTAADLETYIITDNEVRVRLERVNVELYGSSWDIGKAKSNEEVATLMDRKTSVAKKRRRENITEQESVETAIAKALRGRGASTVNLSQIGVLIPGLSEDAPISDTASVDDDWY